jgi:hypothetical protein
VWRRCDPIATRLRLSASNGGERWLVRRGLEYLESAVRRRGEVDPLFAQIFWQVLRVRCIYYRFVVQRPMTAGLQWFVRFYDRIGPMSSPLWSVCSEAAYQVAGSDMPIAALEIRMGLREAPEKIAEGLRSTLVSWQRVLIQIGNVGGNVGQEPEFGVVLSFGKDRDPGAWKKGAPPAFWRQTFAEPRPGRPRYAGFLSERAAQARALASLLRAVPLALWAVRGLDVASDELGVPTWVLVPLYRYVRQEADYAAVHQRAEAVQPLRSTAHVGEDFRHLMEGLRRIHEAVHYLLGPAGGRLGHGTALGIEPRHWAETVGSAMMPFEDRLWDLVFEWRLYSGHRVLPEFRAKAPPGRYERLENDIRELALHVFKDLFRDPHLYDPPVLAEAHVRLHEFMCPEGWGEMTEGSIGSIDRGLEALKRKRPARPRPMGCPLSADRRDGVDRELGASERRCPARPRLDDCPLPASREDSVITVLDAYLTSPEAFRRGQELADIILDTAEIEAIIAVQEAMRRGIASRGIVVEVNPSSNLLIGDLLDLRNHPILRLFPPEQSPGMPEVPVPIAVGSDDPVTFSTALLREYELLQQAARAAGYSQHTTQEWLEAIRQTGMDARFTVAWRPSAFKMADRLIGALDGYLQRATDWTLRSTIDELHGGRLSPWGAG